MKVIRRGNKEPLWFQVTCAGCSSLLEVELAECRLVRDKKGDTYALVCVVCTEPAALTLAQIEQSKVKS